MNYAEFVQAYLPHIRQDDMPKIADEKDLKNLYEKLMGESLTEETDFEKQFDFSCKLSAWARMKMVDAAWEEYKKRAEG